jgi:TPR repeat protein
MAPYVCSNVSVLGERGVTGTGLARDDTQAARWLRAAAEGRDTAAKNNLGVLHATGQGVLYDRAEAERWFAAAAQGAEDALRNLQVLRSTPPGAPPPHTAAAKFSSLAAIVVLCTAAAGPAMAAEPRPTGMSRARLWQHPDRSINSKPRPGAPLPASGPGSPRCIGLGRTHGLSASASRCSSPAAAEARVAGRPTRHRATRSTPTRQASSSRHLSRPSPRRR